MQTIEKFVDSISSIPDKDRLITNPYCIDICFPILLVSSKNSLLISGAHAPAGQVAGSAKRKNGA